MHIRKPAVYVSLRAVYVFASSPPCTLPRRPMPPLRVFICASPPPLFLARQGADPSMQLPWCSARMLEQPLCAWSACNGIESLSFALVRARICKARTNSQLHECRGC